MSVEELVLRNDIPEIIELCEQNGKDPGIAIEKYWAGYAEHKKIYGTFRNIMCADKYFTWMNMRYDYAYSKTMRYINGNEEN